MECSDDILQSVLSLKPLPKRTKSPKRSCKSPKRVSRKSPRKSPKIRGGQDPFKFKATSDEQPLTVTDALLYSPKAFLDVGLTVAKSLVTVPKSVSK